MLDRASFPDPVVAAAVLHDVLLEALEQLPPGVGGG
jgi:hypothetical protein